MDGFPRKQQGSCRRVDRALEGGYVAVARPNLALWVPPELCEAPLGCIAPGMEVGLRMPKEMGRCSRFLHGDGDRSLEPSNSARC